jgi:hypothetical protein
MTALASEDVLVRPGWARLKRCQVRDRWLFLVPEQVLFPCPTTVEVLQALDRPTSFGAIVATLAAEYDAPAETIAADLAPLVGELVEQGYVRRLDP